MKSAAFIPIKSYSERVNNKNFNIIRGRKLYEHIILKAIKSKCFDEVFVDTDSDEIKTFCEGKVNVIDRLPLLAKDDANGNDLLKYHYCKYPNYDLYFQLFATSPFLTIDTISKCVTILTTSKQHDSILTVSKEPGWYWLNDQPVNFRPCILPRSQDAKHLLKETTGLYGITRQSLHKYGCRTGGNPYMYIVDNSESIDLDTLADFERANQTSTLCETEIHNPYIYD